MTGYCCKQLLLSHQSTAIITKHTSRITIRQLIRLATLKLIRKDLFDLFVRHSITGSRIQFIQITTCHGSKLHPRNFISVVISMLDGFVLYELRRLLCPTQSTRPKSSRSRYLNFFSCFFVFRCRVANVFFGKHG